MFPIRLKDVSDPMTGFFLIDRRTVDAATLKPRGFKILLEILARKNLRVAEVPFDFAGRHAGESKASMRQGLHFLTQLTALRFGKMSLFAVIGGLGAVANIAIVWALTSLGVNYIVAAIIASEVTIIGELPAAGAVRLPRHAGRGIRCLGAVRQVVHVQQRRAAHPHPDRGADGQRRPHLRRDRHGASRSSSRSSCGSCSTRSSSTRRARPARRSAGRASSSRSSTRRRCRRASSSRSAPRSRRRSCRS